jgi:hypothetical protein
MNRISADTRHEIDMTCYEVLPDDWPTSSHHHHNAGQQMTVQGNTLVSADKPSSSPPTAILAAHYSGFQETRAYKTFCDKWFVSGWRFAPVDSETLSAKTPTVYGAALLGAFAVQIVRDIPDERILARPISPRYSCRCGMAMWDLAHVLKIHLIRTHNIDSNLLICRQPAAVAPAQAIDVSAQDATARETRKKDTEMLHAKVHKRARTNRCLHTCGCVDKETGLVEMHRILHPRSVQSHMDNVTQLHPYCGVHCPGSI